MPTLDGTDGAAAFTDTNRGDVRPKQVNPGAGEAGRTKGQPLGKGPSVHEEGLSKADIVQSEVREVKEDNWQHRSLGMKCMTCMWFVEKPAKGGGPHLDATLGRCRRHAPSMHGWPVMFESDWCGDHKIDEEKV